MSSWYRLYRPKQVSELNITSVRESLLHMMQHAKIPQALLFAGPKGTGKTSASRILGALLNDPVNEAVVDHVLFGGAAPAKKVLQEPDPERDFARRVYDGHSFVVQELDAASNRRIDDIRLLKERIHLPPTEGKVTVYILDEVHMLTTEAFNALLKILEEPPAHVVFILATTELHKIPATIVSRCSVIHFRKATGDELRAALERVLKAEGISCEPSDLEPIIVRADGSFRDGVKLLELACQGGHFDSEHIKDLLAPDTGVYIKQLFDMAIAKDPVALSNVFIQLRDHNYNPRDFYKDCFAFLHRDLLTNLGVMEGTPIYATRIDHFFLKELLAANLLQESPIPFLVLELKLLDLIERAKKTTEQSPPPTPKPAEAKKKIEISLPAQHQEEVQPVATIQVVEKLTTTTPSGTLVEIWQRLLTALATNNFSLQTLLKSCQLESWQQGIAEVAVYYSFHKEQLEQMKNQEILRSISRELFGGDYAFNFILQETTPLAVGGAESELVQATKDALL